MIGIDLRGYPLIDALGSGEPKAAVDEILLIIDDDQQTLHASSSSFRMSSADR